MRKKIDFFGAKIRSLSRAIWPRALCLRAIRPRAIWPRALRPRAVYSCALWIWAILPFFALAIGASSAQAAALEGFYRIEGVGLNTATSFRDTTVYGAHQLTLTPSIIASDGVFIEGRVHVLTSPNLSWPALSRPTPNAATGGNNAGRRGDLSLFGNAGRQGEWMSQWGQDFGRQFFAAQTLQVAELYATFDHGRGMLLLGRQALPFGLGLLYHGGRGLRDHWYNSYDMLAYQMNWGRLSLTPRLGIEKRALRYMVQLDYSHENNFKASVLYQKYKGRAVSLASVVNNGGAGAEGGLLSVPLATTMQETPAPAASPSTDEDFNQNIISAYYEKTWANLKLQLEGHYIKGTQPARYGLLASGAAASPAVAQSAVVDQNAFAFAGRGELKKDPWTVRLDAGFVRGDDASTDDVEAFIAHPNYTPSLLMFNYIATGGQTPGERALSSQGVGDLRRPTTQQVEQKHLDVGVLSDAVYVAPRVERQLGTRWLSHLGAAVGWRAQGFSYIGLEANGGIEYAPHPRFSWRTQGGFMSLAETEQPDGSYVYTLQSSMVLQF